jgi:hypothetical protein
MSFAANNRCSRVGPYRDCLPADIGRHMRRFRTQLPPRFREEKLPSNLPWMDLIRVITQSVGLSRPGRWPSWAKPGLTRTARAKTRKRIFIVSPYASGSERPWLYSAIPEIGILRKRSASRVPQTWGPLMVRRDVCNSSAPVVCPSLEPSPACAGREHSS